jgi:hypothetical protein
MPGGKTIVMNAIAYMKTRFNIDPLKVFIGGYSGGGDMAYYVAFSDSRTFAGVIAENTNPWRDNPFRNSPGAAFSANASGWKFNVAHLYHTNDENYTKAETENALDTMRDNGYPVNRSKQPGSHSDVNTASDLRAWFPHWIQSADWEAPDSLPMLDLVGELLNPIGSLRGCIALTADFEAIDHCLEFVKDDLASLRHNDARKLAEFFFFVTRNKIEVNFRPRPIPSNTIRAQFPPAGSHLTRGSIITLDHGP